jgi:hypothetical protein
MLYVIDRSCLVVLEQMAVAEDDARPLADQKSQIEQAAHATFW